MTEQRTLEEARARALAHEQRRGWSRHYPDTCMVDEGFKLRRRVRQVLKRFKRDPRRREDATFVAAVAELYEGLARAYRIPTPEVTHEGPWEGSSGGSAYYRFDHSIVLRGKRSILTAQHEFTHARGYGETGAVWRSVNAFRVVFPRAFGLLLPQGCVLLRPETATNPPPPEFIYEHAVS